MMKKWSCIISIVLLVFIVFFDLFLLMRLNENTNNLRSLQSQLELERNDAQPAQVEIEFYRELNNKIDGCITQVYSVLGICLTVFTIAGGVVAFKAPLDLENQIGKLKNEIKRVDGLNKESAYQSKMIAARSKETSFEKIAELGKIIDEFPNRPEPYLERGEERLNLKAIDEAISDFKIAKKLGASNVDYYTLMGKTLNRKRAYSDALKFYAQAIEEAPDSRRALGGMAYSYKGLKQYEDALKCLTKVLENEPSNYAALYNRSLIYKEIAGYEDEKSNKDDCERNRVKDLLQAEKINPEYRPIQNAIRLDMRYSNSNSEEDISRIKTYARLCFENANEYWVEGDIENAITQYDRAAWAWRALFDKGREVQEASNTLQGIAQRGEEICKEHSLYVDAIHDKENLSLEISDYEIEKGVNAYLNGMFEKAEELFTNVLIIEDNEADDIARINLAFMRRRGETQGITDDALKLLDRCRDKWKKSAFWTFNRALIEINVSGEGEALQIIKQTQRDVDDALDWWSNVRLIDSKEIRIILTLLNKTTIKYDNEKFDCYLS